MALATLLGIQPVDFDTSEGKNIKGLKLHISFPDPDVMGTACDQKFMTEAACKNLNVNLDILSEYVGCAINIDTNPKGKLISITPA